MYSDVQSSEQQNNQDEINSVFGLYFCHTCKNLMTPMRANGNILQFNCPICGKMPIDFSNRKNNDAMLYSKQLQIGFKKYQPDNKLIFDPAMPTVQIQCPSCGFHQAVYLLIPDQSQSKIICKMICASKMQGKTVKCGNTWDLQDYDLLEKYGIKLGNEPYRRRNKKQQQDDSD